MHYYDINNDTFHMISDKSFLILLLRGYLVWQPSGLREKFIIIMNRQTSICTIHWMNFKSEKLSRIIKIPNIVEMLNQQLIIKRILFPIEIDQYLWCNDGIPRKSYRLILNKSMLKSHPAYNEIIAESVILRG